MRVRQPPQGQRQQPGCAEVGHTGHREISSRAAVSACGPSGWTSLRFHSPEQAFAVVHADQSVRKDPLLQQRAQAGSVCGEGGPAPLAFREIGVLPEQRHLAFIVGITALTWKTLFIRTFSSTGRASGPTSSSRRPWSRAGIPVGHPGIRDQSTSAQPSSAGWSHTAHSICGYSRRNRATAASLTAASITHISRRLPRDFTQNGVRETLPGRAPNARTGQ